MNVFSKYFIDPIKNHYLDFGGRATRTQYWAFVGWNILVNFVFTLAMVLGGQVADFLATLVTLVFGLFYLAIFLPSLAIGARRLRDGGFSPWLLLVGFVPFVGGLILLVLFLLPSKN